MPRSAARPPSICRRARTSSARSISRAWARAGCQRSPRSLGAGAAPASASYGSTRCATAGACGRELWQLVDTCAMWAAGEDPAPPRALHEVIQRAIAYKATIVGRDERELTGHRALLNLGHTVGHAIESATGLHHGEAVGLGLIA